MFRVKLIITEIGLYANVIFPDMKCPGLRRPFYPKMILTVPGGRQNNY